MQTHAPATPKNVLITGGAGFIGSHLVRKFLKSGSTVHVFDNLYTGRMDNLPGHPNLFFHEGSIMDLPALERLKAYSFDVIFHLASVVGMRLATKYQQLVYDTATTGTLNVLNTFREVPVVLFSSSAVYGMDNKFAVKETAQVDFEQLLQYDGGKLGYACGKYEMEQIGRRAAQNGRKVLIIRPFNVVGKRQLGTYGMVIPTFIHQALQGKPLTIYDDGFQVRSFSCIQTFVKCLCKLMEHEEVWTADKNIVNIGTNNGHSINDLAGIVLQETKSHSLVKYHLYEDFFQNHKDVVYRVPDTTYGEQFYGKIEWPSLRDIVKDILQTFTVESVKTEAQFPAS
jgi:UDP-glucose 4-epimerase